VTNTIPAQRDTFLSVEQLARALHNVLRHRGSVGSHPWEALFEDAQADYEALARRAAAWLGVQLSPEEPVVRSVALDCAGRAWQSAPMGEGIYWFAAVPLGEAFRAERAPVSWEALDSAFGPLTVIHTPADADAVPGSTE
jgi:hypothetical protein